MTASTTSGAWHPATSSCARWAPRQKNVRQWRPRRQGEAYTESEAKLMVEQFFAGTSVAAPAAAAAGEEPAVAEAAAPVEEVPVRSGLIVDGVRS